MERVKSTPLSSTGAFSKLINDYLNEEPQLKSFYNRAPKAESILDQLKEKSEKPVNREVLVKSLNDQYRKAGYGPEGLLKRNLDLLNSNSTFTFTTGHQLNLMTGPLFFHLKVMSAIAHARKAKEAHPEYDFVPIFWMATEDHDFEEINHFFIGDKKYSWEKESSGAVGRLDTSGIKEILESTGLNLDKVQKIYDSSETLSIAHRRLTHLFYGEMGLIILDGDDPVLKSLFSNQLQEELFDQFSFKAVNKTSQELEAMGYKVQVTPREINLFFLGDFTRRRLENKSEEWIEVEGNRTFSRQEIESLLSTSPEMFSPNVVLRPLYQEEILPNLGYIGGPGELAYWLQLRSMFETADVPFPLLIPRIFGLFAFEKELNWLDKMGFELKDIFQSKRDLELLWIRSNKHSDFDLSKQDSELEEIESKLKELSGSLDKTLEAYVGARFKAIQKEIQRISIKMRKASERKYSEELNRIDKLKKAWFPGDVLQERRQNYLSFFPEDGGSIGQIADQIDPWELDFNVFKL